jgi:hypothetical protein
MVLIIVGIVLVCATAVTIVFLLRSGDAEEEPPPVVVSGARVITPENVHEISMEIAEKVERGMFETYMNTTWTFPDGKSASSDAVMGNSVNNRFAFYFTVTLNDTDETVFTSGLIPVGTQIAEIVLEKDLAAGTYPAVVVVNMIDDDGEPVETNTGINVTLIIRN